MVRAIWPDIARVSYLALVFDGPELRNVCEVISNRAIEEAAGITDERALSSTVDELVDEIMTGYDMELPVLLFDEK